MSEISVSSFNVSYSFISRQTNIVLVLTLSLSSDCY